MKQLLRNILLAVRRFLTLPKRCAAAEAMVEKLRAHNKALAADLMRSVRDSSELNLLTYPEIERLGMLAQECGAVVQAVGKILRDGYQGQEPCSPTNRVRLEREAGEVRAVIELMMEHGDLRGGDVRHWQWTKAAKVRNGKSR